MKALAVVVWIEPLPHLYTAAGLKCQPSSRRNPQGRNTGAALPWGRTRIPGTLQTKRPPKNVVLVFPRRISVRALI